MVFLRIKKIKDKNYAYLVENSWIGNSSRQKVKRYIGRVYKFDLKNNVEFESFFNINSIEEYIKNNENKKIIKDLIKWEFFKNDIDDKKFNIDFEKIEIKNNEKNACIKINEGYLCSHTLANILNLKRLHEDETKSEIDDETDDETGFRLAKSFVDAGIKIPQEVFIGIFEKIKKADKKPSFEGFYY